MTIIQKGEPMSLRNEQCNKVCRILDDVLANRPTERDSLITAVRKAFGALETEPQWIPCSERLPEQYGNYLVSYRTDDFESDIGTFDPDRINSDTGEWSACDANGFYWVASKRLEVIAWMPLPEPYQAERREE